MQTEKTITIKKRTYTRDHAQRLLRNNGWIDDVTGFLDSLPEGKWYCDLQTFKRHFRQWRTERNRLRDRAEWERLLGELPNRLFLESMN